MQREQLLTRGHLRHIGLRKQALNILGSDRLDVSDTAVAELGHVAEGVWSAPAIVGRAHALGVEMPISEAVCAVLDGRSSARDAVERLLSRDPRAERG